MFGAVPGAGALSLGADEGKPKHGRERMLFQILARDHRFPARLGGCDLIPSLIKREQEDPSSNCSMSNLN